METKFYHSGYINYRGRKTGIVFSGETAEHIMDNHLQTPETHPLKHIRIQQLAKRVPVWKSKGGKRFEGEVLDNKTNIRYLVIAEIYRNFALIITCYKYK